MLHLQQLVEETWLHLHQRLQCPPPSPTQAPTVNPTTTPIVNPNHPIPSSNSTIDRQIDFALTLDIMSNPRLNRSGTSNIIVHERKQAGETERSMIMITAFRWGWKQNLPLKTKRHILKAAVRQVSFDYGFLKDLATELTFTRWLKKIDSSIESGV